MFASGDTGCLSDIPCSTHKDHSVAVLQFNDYKSLQTHCADMGIPLHELPDSMSPHLLDAPWLLVRTNTGNTAEEAYRLPLQIDFGSEEVLGPIFSNTSDSTRVTLLVLSPDPQYESSLSLQFLDRFSPSPYNPRSILRTKEEDYFTYHPTTLEGVVAEGTTYRSRILIPMDWNQYSSYFLSRSTGVVSNEEMVLGNDHLSRQYYREYAYGGKARLQAYVALSAVVLSCVFTLGVLGLLFKRSSAIKRFPIIVLSIVTLCIMCASVWLLKSYFEEGWGTTHSREYTLDRLPEDIEHILDQYVDNDVTLDQCKQLLEHALNGPVETCLNKDGSTDIMLYDICQRLSHNKEIFVFTRVNEREEKD